MLPVKVENKFLWKQGERITLSFKISKTSFIADTPTLEVKAGISKSNTKTSHQGQ